MVGQMAGLIVIQMGIQIGEGGMSTKLINYFFGERDFVQTLNILFSLDMAWLLFPEKLRKEIR